MAEVRDADINNQWREILNRVLIGEGTLSQMRRWVSDDTIYHAKAADFMQKPDPRQQIVTHLPALRAFAISLTRNHALADDIVQDTILKAWTRIDQFRVGTNMQAWLFTILRNTFYSHRRKRAREVEDLDQIYTDTLVTKPAHDGTLQMRDFYRALVQLPVAQRETLILLGAAGYSYEEAATICGVAPGTIKSRANRARRRLAELMDLDTGGPVPLTDAATRAIVGGKAAQKKARTNGGPFKRL